MSCASSGTSRGCRSGKIKREIREQTICCLRVRSPSIRRSSPSSSSRSASARTSSPGVNAGQVYVRNYPEGNLGAHLFGFVSEINEEQLKEPTFDGLDPGDRIGATGIEAQYDSVLRGRSGATRVQVDAFGEPRGKELSSVEPKAGESLVLTLDEKIQRAGEDALASYGLPGAFVVMRVDDGAILGMGSNPDLRSEHLHAAGLDQIDRGPRRRRDGAADEPGDPVGLRDGLDVQAGHRDRGPPGGVDHAGGGDQRRRVHHRRHSGVRERRTGFERAGEHDRLAAGVLRRLLLPAGTGARERRPGGPAEVGDQLRLRQRHRHRPPGRGLGSRAHAGAS